MIEPISSSRRLTQMRRAELVVDRAAGDRLAEVAVQDAADPVRVRAEQRVLSLTPSRSACASMTAAGGGGLRPS